MSAVKVEWNILGTVLSTSGGEDGKVRVWKREFLSTHLKSECRGEGLACPLPLPAWTRPGVVMKPSSLRRADMPRPFSRSYLYRSVATSRCAEHTRVFWSRRGPWRLRMSE